MKKSITSRGILLQKELGGGGVVIGVLYVLLGRRELRNEFWIRLASCFSSFWRRQLKK